MRTGDAALEVKESVATIMKSLNWHILFHFPEVEQQKDGSSCGLFALAFAFDVCDRKDPSLREYLPDNFCPHFRTCLIPQEITSFPSRKITMAVKPRSILRRVKIFCHCRLPDSDDDMVNAQNVLTGITSLALE
uniref:Ubiquitin-like protease family profile domain-containing protein n=1 Tax=Amphimedon queenslandica TaxID=400682 RepID=A0A1X7V8G6_AMPQE